MHLTVIKEEIETQTPIPKFSKTNKTCIEVVI